MKYAIQTTAIFDKWASSLKGTAAAKVVGMRLDRLANGNLGDIKTLGDGVSEMSFFVGAGPDTAYISLFGALKSLSCFAVAISRPSKVT